MTNLNVTAENEEYNQRVLKYNERVAFIEKVRQYLICPVHNQKIELPRIHANLQIDIIGCCPEFVDEVYEIINLKFPPNIY